MNYAPVAVVFSNYSLPTRQFARYRGQRLAKYGATLRTPDNRPVQAKVTYRYYDVLGPSITTITATIVVRF